LARVKALLRRSGLTAIRLQKEPITIGELTIEPLKRKVTLANRKVELTPREFDLLYLFMTNPGRSYSREALLNTIWGYDFNGYEHTVNSHINRLRTKIEPDLSKPKYILTSWGVGYHFTDEL
jgi:DNA-binding response OmpR family regulator